MTGSAEGRTFGWTVDEGAWWPPRGRQRAPYGPTEVEVIRSCPLRSCFESSSGYERRQGFAARIGTAFHRTLQSLDRQPVETLEPAAVAEEAGKRFDAELAKQAAQADARPREKWLPRDEARAASARTAVMYEARRLAELGWLPVAGEVMREATALTEVVEHEWRPPVETEVPVESRDGMFRGRVDRAEHDAGGGTKLVDVKSALRPDLPERYERQLQLYALMWRDTRGEWPAEAVVVYPFTGVEYAVTIDAQTCERVAAEAVSVVRVLAEQRNAERLGTPGDVCKVCEYRPWCRPFWRWQAGERNRMVALEGAVMGFEGTLESVEKIGEQWRLTMRWREGAMVRVVAPADRFAQLEQATPGMRVRVLDTRLQGMPNRPQGVAGGPSEIWLVA